MVGKKRMIKLSEILKKILMLKELKTQDLRVQLIADLQQLFNLSKQMAKTAENPEDWVKICGYIAQVINSLSNAYDEVRFNEQMRELENLIEEAKRRSGKASQGAGIA
jgi:Icc-related predicted phosphoesterase